MFRQFQRNCAIWQQQQKLSQGLLHSLQLPSAFRPITLKQRQRLGILRSSNLVMGKRKIYSALAHEIPLTTVPIPPPTFDSSVSPPLKRRKSKSTVSAISRELSILRLTLLRNRAKLREPSTFQFPPIQMKMQTSSTDLKRSEHPQMQMSKTRD